MSEICCEMCNRVRDCVRTTGKPWVGLTVDEMLLTVSRLQPFNGLVLARQIEQILKEKNT